MAKKMAKKKTTMDKVEVITIAKEDLEATAIELSTIMKFKDPIPTGKVTIEELTADIKEAALELEQADVISDKTKAVMKEIEIILPWDIIETEEESAPETETKAVEIDKEAKKKKNSGFGVIKSILEFITESKGITILKIHEKLITRFPTRNSISMLKTIKAQIGGKKFPCRMEKEKKVVFQKDEDKYAIKK
jgi:hypothetical protein